MKWFSYPQRVPRKNKIILGYYNENPYKGEPNMVLQPFLTDLLTFPTHKASRVILCFQHEMCEEQAMIELFYWQYFQMPPKVKIEIPKSHIASEPKEWKGELQSDGNQWRMSKNYGFLEDIKDDESSNKSAVLKLLHPTY